jgi:hypothetical protein
MSTSAEETLNRLLDQKRKASREYYNRKFKLAESLTEEQNAEIKANRAELKEKIKAKKEANPEYYKAKRREYGERQKAKQLQLETTV